MKGLRLGEDRAIGITGATYTEILFRISMTAILFPTWLVSRGVPIWDAAGFLGTSPEMIERHYGHYRPDYQDAAVRAIGAK
jgi:hypothetical protein